MFFVFVGLEDGKEGRLGKLDVADQNGSAVFTIGPEFKTIWYEVVVQ